MLRLGNGDLLAVAEGRLANSGDHNGVIRVAGKISQDRGETRGAVFIIARNILPDGTEHVAQNPSPVLDMVDPHYLQGRAINIYNNTESGEQLIIGGSGMRRAYSIESFDNGRAWVNDIDITDQVHNSLKPNYTAAYADRAYRYNLPAGWRMNFSATGHGIQLRSRLPNNPATRGRLLFRATLTQGSKSVRRAQFHVYWSAGLGRSWTIGRTSDVLGSSEAMAVKLESGDIRVNFRIYTGSDGVPVNCRGVMVHEFDEIGNLSMAQNYRNDTGLPDPIVQDSMQCYTWSDQADYAGKSRILLSNPNSQSARKNLTVRLSYYEGATSAVAKRITGRRSGYGDLGILDDMRIGLLSAATAAACERGDGRDTNCV